MKRAIVTPAVLPPSALAEVKQWLGISTTHDDVLLGNLLRAALDMCAAFTGTAPVTAITGVEAISIGGVRTALTADAYALDLTADGTGRVAILSGGNASRFAVRFTAGLAADWSGLPEPLRHGMVRLAAHQHRERESSGAASVPPAAVAALWRPWRRLRLA